MFFGKKISKIDKKKFSIVLKAFLDLTKTFYELL